MYQDKLQNVQKEVNRIIKGKEDVVLKVLAAMIGGGHILMEDIPGVGKTTLATTFARTLSLDYHRVQFTPDVLPSDILGFSMYDKNAGEFVFQEGSIFCNLFLADEINRTSPKTQSALLEVMEERQASIEGQTRKLPDPFIVIATQNPIGSSGTQMLPESQLDRFLICLSMGYPAHEDAVSLLKGEVWNQVEAVNPALSLEELREARAAAEKIFVHDAIYEYIVELVELTRTDDLFSLGASPRASIALLRMSRAMALLAGRDFVTAGDVQSVLGDVLGHRVKPGARARAEGKNVQGCIQTLLHKVKSPRC
ncbi:MAG: MoxR family ATPase [Blautia sp.]|nr:MoxR family ATPase [Muribaculaceae bacterium]MCM1144796.1 MoxR family ATPase [Lachnoclostridium sp.]MCM1212047.1 MoxR family ATPase [Blautia sp.]